MAAELPAAADFHKDIQPILAKYCYDCHGDGMSKGGVTFDQFASDKAMLDNHELWWNAIRYLRLGIMPPPKKNRPTSEERERIEQWVKTGVFGIDPTNPDPGRITIRRLNRNEYQNTIRDLMGIRFEAQAEFPPDDTGYGFDDIGDVLTVSPMLLEKYLTAAQEIVEQAVPLVTRVMPVQVISGNRFVGATPASQGQRRGAGNNRNANPLLSFYEANTISNTFSLDNAGDYKLSFELQVKGNAVVDPGKCRVSIQLDGQELKQEEFGWVRQPDFSARISREARRGVARRRHCGAAIDAG